MPMSPRLLRPRQTGFDPRSISGLALWLDAADSSTLFQDAAATIPATATNDPVGAWLDKSGNNRHATQGTAGRRGARGSQNSRTAVSLDGIDDHLILGDLSAAFPSAAEVAVAYAAPSDVLYVIYQTANNDTSDAWGTQTFSGAFRAARLNAVPLIWPTGSILFGVSSDSSAHRIRLQGADVVTSAANFSAGTSHAIGARTASPDGTTAMNGRIAEVVAYSRVLTTSERTRLYRYLAAKWGITLAPQVSNADAQDWVNRVYANGGTVSATTASAVNQFCVDIENAGIRDRFYRLNLFAGNSDASLNAVRTPLFRGPSLTGTQYGGTTDTNASFVQGDYAETGVGAGLTGNGLTKYLNTGYPANTLAASNTHLGIGLLATTAQSGVRTAIGAYNNGANTLEVMIRSADATARPGIFTRFATATDRMGENVGTTGAALAVGNNVAAWPTFYRNGVAVGTDATTSQDYPSAHAIWVFANNIAGTTPAINITACRLGWYSIGATMTSTQALAFHNAIAAFSTALSRT